MTNVGHSEQCEESQNLASFPFVRNDVCTLLMGHFIPLPLGEGAVVRAKRATNAGEGKIMTNAGHSVLDTESQSLSKENPSLPSLKKGRSTGKVAFTLAEVLITLGIIGVVAAMTIPSLVQNYQEKATVTKVKKFYSVFSQAYLMAIEEHGPICDWGLEDSELVEDEDGNKIHSDNSFEQSDKFFGIIEQYLPKGKYKKLHNTSVGNENDGYVMLDGTRIIGMWLEPSKCTLNNPTSYCGDFYVVFDNKNYYESRGKYFKPSVFAFYINPARIFPVGANDTVFKKDCLTGYNYSKCTGWVITNGNMDYLHCKDLDWSTKTKCK